MGCCDRSRRAAAAVATGPAPSSGANVRGSRAPQPPRLQYLGRRAIEVRGGATGRTYRFDPQNRTQTVEPRDVAGLLRTKLFSQA